MKFLTETARQLMLYQAQIELRRALAVLALAEFQASGTEWE